MKDNKYFNRYMEYERKISTLHITLNLLSAI